MIFRISLIFGFLFIPFTYTSAQESSEGTSAVFLTYHRFGEENLPSTNVKISQFKEQVKALLEGGHSFPDLTSTISNLKNKALQTPKSVILTVDDGYKSILTDAWPILKENGIPLTIFISTDPIDSGQSNYLSWNDIRQLVREGVKIAHHGANHGHGPQGSLEDFKEDIEKASKRFKEELGIIPDIFAFPYGEYTPELQRALKELGFKAAFGQFSGAAGPSNDPFALPRYAINEKYSNISRFKLLINSISLPVANVVPENPILEQENNPPSFGFSLTEKISNLNKIACYPSHLGKAADIHFIGSSRIEVRFKKPFPIGRSRINCTLPGPNGRWYWFGRPFIVYE